MPTSTTVTNLPTISEIKSGDLLIVQTSNTTGTLRFDDFIIGEEHVSFFKDIQDISTDVQILSGQITPYIDQIKSIGSIESSLSAHSSGVSEFHDRINEVRESLDEINTRLAELSGTVTAELSILSERITAVEDTQQALLENS